MLRARVRRARSELAQPAGCLLGNRAGKAATEVPPRTRGEGWTVFHLPFAPLVRNSRQIDHTYSLDLIGSNVIAS